MNKVITYSTFTIATIFVIFAFVTATTYTQLGLAVILYPLVTFLAFKLFPRKSDSVMPPQNTYLAQPQAMPVSPPAKPITQTIEVTKTKNEEVDLDKRSFLKLIGTMGVALFLSSLLGERIGSLLFGKSMGGGAQPTGTTTASITEGYKITEADEDIISYYGFTNQKGNWLIMRNDIEENSYRYAKGSSNFPNSWSNREKLKYDYYFNLPN